MAEIDTAALLAGVDIVRVIDGYVPLKKNNNEWEACCPFHTEATPSFKVSPAKQFYHCFGCGAHGDAITFLREFKQLSFAEACQLLGGTSPAGDTPAGPPPAARASVKNNNTSRWAPHLPVPANAPPPHVAHVVRGRPECTWCYRNLAGDVIGYVYRFRTSEGGKEVLPLSWCRHAGTGAEEWRWMSFAQPRPLYGLQRLATIAADAAVLLVEGEKCADAAQAELDAIGNKTVVLAWPGGGKAVHKVDWQPLAGHTVLLWPDCDAKREPLTPTEKQAGINQHDKPLLPPDKQPGISTMQQIGTILTGLGCNVSSINIPPAGTVPDGWDVADAIAEGMIGDKLITYILQNIMPFDAASDGGTTECATPVYSDAPPDIDTPPPEAYTDEPAANTGTKNAPKAAPAAKDKRKKRVYEGWRADLARNEKGGILGWVSNVVLVLSNDAEFADSLQFCALSYRILKTRKIIDQLEPGEWTDSDTAHVLDWLGRKYYFNPGDKAVAFALVVVAQHNTVHPVREYLRSLVWDGTPRLDSWLLEIFDARPKNENQPDGYKYLNFVGRYFLIGAVARVMAAPVKMDNVLILEGLQGEGKSTAAAVLFGEGWFSDSPVPIGDKDAYQVIQGMWGVELAELDSFNKAESTSAKTFFSSQTDRYRPSYGHMAQSFPRQCVFIGTTNQDEYLKDYTGNRRYWPVYCMEVNLAALRAMRDQLWAEALHYYQLGTVHAERSDLTRWWPIQAQKALFEAEQDARLQIDPWQTNIENYLYKTTYEYVTSSTILQDAIGKVAGQITRADQNRISPIMHALGWVNKKMRIAIEGANKPSPRHVYVRPASWNTKGGGDAPF